MNPQLIRFFCANGTPTESLKFKYQGKHDLDPENALLDGNHLERSGNIHLGSVIGSECLENKDNEIIIPIVPFSQNNDNATNHTPLRLTGGGNNFFDSLTSDYQRNDLDRSLSEQDIRDVMFEAGYTIETIDDILSAKAMAGLNGLSNSTASVESDISSTEFIRGGDLTDLGDISVSDSGTENAFDTLKEIQLKNVN